MEENNTYINQSEITNTPEPTPVEAPASPLGNGTPTPPNRQVLLGLLAAILLVVGLFTTLIVIKQRQNTRQSASGPVCPVNGATCSWDSVAGATSYHYKVVNVSSNQVIKEGDTSQTSVLFTSEAGQTYSCSVNAINVCGAGDVTKTQATCPAVPTPTTPVTNTPTLTPTVTPSPIPGASATPTQKPTVTPTDSPTPIATLTPTNSPTLTNSPTPITNTITQSSSPTNSPTPIPTTAFVATPTITVAPTGPGEIFTNVGIVGAEALLIGALILVAF